jgi:prepilin-type N-terminal cleavage/methylation domain-containing protein
MKRAGFSLAELLVTLFLLSLVIAVAADLMHRSRQVSRFYRQRDALQSAAFALQLLAQQSCAAVEITQPTLGGSSTNLVFQRIRNDISTRLPTTLGSNPAPLPASPPVWQPAATGFRETITVTRNAQG